MVATDTCVSVCPYFQIHPGQATAFRAVCEKYVTWSAREPGCLYYLFSFDGHFAHCPEGFQNADALLAHLDNLRPILHEMNEVSSLVKIEIHGPEQELAKLKEPLARLNPQWFKLEFGYRK